MKPPVVASKSDWLPVSVDELIFQLRAETEDYPEGSVQYQALERLIGQAVDWIEGYTGRTIVDSELDLYFDAFPVGKLRLNAYPIRSVDAIAYRDADSANQTLELSAVVQDLVSLRPSLEVIDGWPETDGLQNAVNVTVTAGYASADAVPSALKGLVLMVANHFHDNPSGVNAANLSETPIGIQSLATRYRVEWL